MPCWSLPLEMVQVKFRGPDVAGGGELESVTFNGNCVRNKGDIGSLPADVRGKEGVVQVCDKVF